MATRVFGKAIVSTKKNHSNVQVPSQRLGNTLLEFVGLALREVDVAKRPPEPICDSAAVDVYRKNGSV